jgi:hypothetical protein
MKKAVTIICLLAVSLLLAGCGQATPEERFLSHWEKIVALINENKNDPAKARAAVKSYLDANLAEMKTLAGQFGQEASQKIAQNPDFIDRVIKIVDTIENLKKTNPSLVDDPQLAQAYQPLSDLTK